MNRILKIGMDVHSTDDFLTSVILFVILIP